MMTKRLYLIALFFGVSSALFAQKTNGYDLYVSSVIVNLLRKNMSILPINHSIITQKSFYTEGGNYPKVQLQLDNKNKHKTGTFSFNFVINTDKRYALDGHSNVVKYLSVFGHFDGDRGAGGGLTITY
jgi:hypothetical protein